MKHLKDRTNRKNRKRKIAKARKHKKTEQRRETKKRQRSNGTLAKNSWIASHSGASRHDSPYASILSGHLLSKITQPDKERMAKGHEKVMEEDDSVNTNGNFIIRTGE